MRSYRASRSRRGVLALGLISIAFVLLGCGLQREPRSSTSVRARVSEQDETAVNRDTVNRDTTVYLVRHAEKAENQGSDPELSPRGRARAKALAKELRDEPIERVFATEYQRTQQTVRPLAQEIGVAVLLMKAGATAEMATRCIEEFLGEIVVIAGHSNTLPQLIKALGIEETIDIPDTRYGDLFVVRLEGESREASLERRRFGG